MTYLVAYPPGLVQVVVFADGLSIRGSVIRLILGVPSSASPVLPLLSTRRLCRVRRASTEWHRQSVSLVESADQIDATRRNLIKNMLQDTVCCIWIIYRKTSPQTNFCRITLFASCASLIVCVLSSNVLLGKVVPIVYGRVKLIGSDLGRGLSVAAGVHAENSRVDEVPYVTDGVCEVHSAYHPIDCIVSRGGVESGRERYLPGPIGQAELDASRWLVLIHLEPRSSLRLVETSTFIEPSRHWVFSPGDGRNRGPKPITGTREGLGLTGS